MADFEKPIHIRWEKDSRYYRVVFQKDLFNTWCLTRVWGKRNASLGQIKHLPVKNYQDGIQKISEIEATTKLFSCLLGSQTICEDLI